MLTLELFHAFTQVKVDLTSLAVAGCGTASLVCCFWCVCWLLFSGVLP